jgi:hypothetical protein
MSCIGENTAIAFELGGKNWLVQRTSRSRGLIHCRHVLLAWHLASAKADYLSCLSRPCLIMTFVQVVPLNSKELLKVA